MEEEIDAFLRRHGQVQMVVNEHGFKGECAKNDEIIERVGGISEAELLLHRDFFAIDEYSVEALSGVQCTRESIKIIEEKLTSALK